MRDLYLGRLSVESPAMLGFQRIGCGKQPAYPRAYPNALENKNGPRTDWHRDTGLTTTKGNS